MKVINLVLIILLVLLIIFLLSRFFFVTDIIYDMLCDADKPGGTTTTGNLARYFSGNKNIIFNKDINENNTSNFMLSVWFYIDNWGQYISQNKNILYLASQADTHLIEEFESTSLLGLSRKYEKDNDSDSNTYKNLHISLDKYNNDLFIDIETYPDNTSSTDLVYTRYVIKNISIQKWNCLTLSVDNKTLDIYLDGKLRNSFILHGIYKGDVPSGQEKNIYLGQIGQSAPTTGNPDKNVGFEGYITRVRYQTNGISPKEAYDIYKKGINASHSKAFYNKYGLKVSFMEYNDEKSSFTI